MAADYQDIRQFDRLIHEPSRLVIMAVLSACESADFTYMLNATGLSKGNLSAHMRKLADAGYLTIDKSFKRNYPHTTCALTRSGRKAFEAYRKLYKEVGKRIGGEEVID